jgi:hypothetical protein
VLEVAADSGKVVLEINLPDPAARESLVTDDEPWKVEDRGEKPAIALKGR